LVGVLATARAAAPLRSISEIQAVGEWNLRDPHPVEIEATVTWVDRQRRMVVLQDGDAAIALHTEGNLANLALGRRIAVEASDCWPVLTSVPDFPARPSGSDLLPTFEGPSRWKTNYLARVRGYVHPPASGLYYFRIASDDTSELWLSSSEDPKLARPIAGVNIWTKAREWTHLPGQQSPPIFLEADKRYYIEAVHEQRWREDHLSVSWEGPGVSPQIIAGPHLSPWVTPAPGKNPAPPIVRGHVLREYWLDRSVESAALLTLPRRLDAILDTTALVVRDLGPSPLPAPRVAQPGEAANAQTNFRWTEIEGIVDFVARRGSTLVLDLVAGPHRTRAIVPDWQGEPPPRLGGRRVRLQGLAEAALNAAGEPLLSTLWVPPTTTIPVLETSPRIANTRLTTIAELLATDPNSLRNQLVRVRGRVVQNENGRLTLSDPGSFYGYVSKDGTNWQPFGAPVEIPMSETVEIGLVVASRSTENVATAVFDHISGLPTAPTQTAVGGPMRAGQFTQEDGRVTLRGSGHDIWISPDQFYFAHTPLTGAGEIVAHIVDFSATDPWAKAGLMIRESLATDAQFVDLLQTGANGCSLQRRKTAEGSAPLSVNDPSLKPPHWLKLTRRFNTISILGEGLEAFAPNARIEVVGYVMPEKDRVIIADGSCRELTEDGDKPAAGQARPLVALANILGPSGNMDRYDVFKAKGVITFAGEVGGRRYVSVQDHSGAAFVTGNTTPRMPALRAGQFVEIYSNPGWTTPSPNLTAANIIVRGEGAFPTPLPHPLEYSLPRRGEGSWVEIEGVVRAISPSGIGEVKTKGELLSFAVSGAAAETLHRYIDGRVRLRGAIAFPSEHERLLLVPSLEHLELVEAPPEQPFAAPGQTIGQLTLEKLLNESPHRLKVRGTVTLVDRDFLYVQDATGGARIDLAEPLALKSGDGLEAVGFPDVAEDHSLVLANALVRQVAASIDVAPLVATAQDLLNGRFGARLIRAQAVVSRVRTTDSDATFELQIEQRLFRATLHGAAEGLPSIPPGSIVSITGICALEAGPAYGTHAGMELASSVPQLLLRSPSDLVVLQKPRWWVVKRTLLITSVVAFVLIVSLVWIHILRRRVAQRTTELRATMEKLQRETQTAATLAERNRLAGEIHDSLEQGFSGLILQLDTTAKKAGCPPEVRAGLTLARNMVAFSRNEVRHAVWDLQSPVLDEGDLGTALKKIVEQLAPETPHTTVSIENTPCPLSSAVEHHLLRIAQEAITNCVKHAEARNLDVVLNYAGDEVILSIRDDGCGFIPGQVLTGGVGHFGLRSLRGRASKIHGTLNITSSPGKGTTVEARVPLRTPALV
jgi:signal transduction histidine kinase